MAVIDLTEKSFRDYATQGETPALVEFWAPWCVYCKRIGPALEKIAEQAGGALTVGRVDIDQAPDLARREGVEAVPTLVLYRQGKAAGTLVAPDSMAKIEEFLRRSLGG